MKRTSKTQTLRMTLACLYAVAPTSAQPSAKAPAAPPLPGLEARAALGAETAAILRGATHIQVFRLLTNTRRAQQEVLAQFQGHASAPVSQGAFGDGMDIDRAGPDQGQAFVAQADRALFDDELYDLGGLSKCFDPGVGLRFWKEKERVDVALCFECGQLSVTTFDAVGRRIHEIPQLAMGFDQPLFVRLAQPVFPKDAEIGAVKPYAFPVEVATPEARAAQEDDIREAIFRRLMMDAEQTRPEKRTRTVYFLSIGPSEHVPVDPDRSLLRRFAGDTPAARPVSACRPGPVSTNAVFLRAAHLWWIEPTTVYAEASYRTAGGVRKSLTYGLKKNAGHWTVTDDTPRLQY